MIEQSLHPAILLYLVLVVYSARFIYLEVAGKHKEKKKRD